MEQKEINLSNHNKSFWTNAIEASIIALIILVPMAFYPRCITVFIPAKEMISEVLIVLSLMFWGLKMISREEIIFTSTPLNFPILSFISICVFSLIWSNSFFVSLKELPLFLAGPLLYFVITNSINDERQINRILDILLIVGGLFGIYGIFQYNGIDFSFWIRNIGRQQVFGLFGNVNFFAEYLIVPLPIAVSLFFASRNKFKKILLLIAILAMGTSIIVTFTRGSYLSFGVSLIFMFFVFLISRGKKFIKNNKKIFIIILLAIIIITLLFVIPNPLNKSGTIISKIKSRISVTQLTQDYSYNRRIAIWKFTGMMIKDHPLLGSGIGTFKYNTLRYQAEFFAQGKNRSLYPYGFADKAHNEYLQLGAELGIIGLGIFIWLMISYFRFGLKILRKIKDAYRQGIIIGLMGAVVAVLVDGIFGFPLHLPATIVLFWLTLALTIAIVMIKSEADAEENNIAKKNPNKKIKGEKDNNISRFKPLLYIGIMLLTIFLCVTITRPFIARIYWFSGDIEIKEKNWDKAIKTYDGALKWDPYLGEMYYNIGKILEIKKLYSVAQEYFEKAEKYVDHPDLPQDFVLIYLKKGQLDKAAIKLKQAISYQSDEKSMLPLYAELGNVYLQLKRYKPAEIVLKDALKIDPNFINAHYGLARAYLKQNLSNEALIELQKVIELAPDSQEANYAKITIQQITKDTTDDVGTGDGPLFPQPSTKN
jgi:O-antigen ligase/tetratricopeptide (TPR) repeat protein